MTEKDQGDMDVRDVSSENEIWLMAGGLSIGSVERSFRLPH